MFGTLESTTDKFLSLFFGAFSRRQLQQHQSTLTTERQRIAGFTERAAAVPGSNEGSLDGFTGNPSP